MRLSELEPVFLTCSEDVGGKWQHTQDAGGKPFTLAAAMGVRFLCPVCFRKNGGSVNTHSVVVWFRNRGVPDNWPPGPGRWEVSGTGLADLTLAPSIQLHAACAWHGFVTNGDVT